MSVKLKAIKIVKAVARIVLPKKIRSALRILKNDGIRGFAIAVKRKIAGSKKRCFSEDAYQFKAIPELKRGNFSIAVHIHLFYDDMANEFCSYLKNIPFDFDLFISCRLDADIESLTKKFAKIRHVKQILIKGVGNRGRDILPFYVSFGKQLLKYKYLMHAHSKKSLYTGSEQTEWRKNSMNGLCGSESLVRKIFYMFENKNIGLVYPENYANVSSIAYSWLKNEACGRELLAKMSIPFQRGVFLYPAGSFFWVRTQAIKPIFDLNLSQEDFPVEAGQNDGTIAHALERVLGITSRYQGFDDAFVDVMGGVIRKGFSVLPFWQFAEQNEDNCFEALSRFDVISFDIFDTLITRVCYEPDDLFMIMSEKIKTEFHKDVDYLRIRKDAEALAWNEKQAFTNINDIYDKLPNVSDFSVEDALCLKQMEIDLEFELAVPRIAMNNVFKKLLMAGKRIILVSDMYLTSDIISKMLEKCGYSGWEAMYISCEVGLRKDADTIWDKIFSIYDKTRFVHCGDNFRSDCQAVGDRCLGSFFPILNPRDALAISNYKNIFLNMNNTAYESLMLGFAINAGAFNSPFAITYDNSDFKIDCAENITCAAFVPLFVHFMQYLATVPKKNEMLLFLAREGKILMPLYEKWCENRGVSMNRHCYFLASRRAVGVAGIQNDSDIENLLLKNQYIGSERGLFLNRLGLEIGDEKRVIDTLHLTKEQRESIFSIIKNNRNVIYEAAKKEADAYKMYALDMFPKDKTMNLSVVDIGWSGTIQYFLSKLFDMKFGGYYYATLGNKPAKIGCECNGLYSSGSDFLQYVTKVQVLFEIILQASDGQLICFEKLSDKVNPVFRERQNILPFVKRMQNILCDAITSFSSISKGLCFDNSVNSNLPELLARAFLNFSIFPKDVLHNFSLEDLYCRNGDLMYNFEKREWEKK